MSNSPAPFIPRNRLDLHSNGAKIVSSGEILIRIALIGCSAFGVLSPVAVVFTSPQEINDHRSTIDISALIMPNSCSVAASTVCVLMKSLQSNQRFNLKCNCFVNWLLRPHRRPLLPAARLTRPFLPREKFAAEKIQCRSRPAIDFARESRS